MSTFKEYQRVKVKVVPESMSDRNLDSSFAPSKIPMINQEGIIIESNGRLHTVEMMNKEGDTEWICDFKEEELILID